MSPSTLINFINPHKLFYQRNLRQLNLNIHPARKLQLRQRIDCLLGRRVNFNQSLVSAQLELLPGFLVDVRRAQDSEDFLFGGQRNRASYDSARGADCLHYFLRAFVHQIVVVAAELNPDFLIHA